MKAHMLAGIGLLALAASGVAFAQGAPRSVWSGVFTAEQAERGKAAYEERCAKCHGPTLAGAEMAPALSGASFLDNWNGIMVGDLVERIRTTMPADNPGSVSRRMATDIVTYILSVNQVPAGAAELPGDAQIQALFRIDASKPGN
jgi:cytochrome c